MESDDLKIFSKKKTDLAGKILRDNTSKKEIHNSLNILSSWRARHIYPMEVFKQRLKRISEKIDKTALSSQRLKRVHSIIKKLRRKYNGKDPTMKLTQMQDISGCRVVLKNVKLARKIYQEHYIKGDLKHKKVKEKNYIEKPKKDGYRSIHLVYKYNSDKESRKDYNIFLIEIQIRSKIQHIWATAIETVDFFTKQALKSNEGKKEWKEFFKLVSSAFAKMENCNIVPNTPNDEKELYSLIKKKEEKLQVIHKLKSWILTVDHFSNLKIRKNLKYFLLTLDNITKQLMIKSYPKSKKNQAIKDYATEEKQIYGKKHYDVVLVGTDTFSDLKKAYPNYFLDNVEFIKLLEKILNKY